MHLNYGSSTYKGKKFTSYYISESYRKDKKVLKNNLFPLGKLNTTQVAQIKLILKVIKKPDDIFTSLNSVIPIREIYYLDIVVVNALWEKWQLDYAFKKVTKSPLNTITMAKILTINRCLYPKSFYNIPKWTGKSILPELLEFDIKSLSDDKIYYELSKIEENKEELENYLFKKAYERKPETFEIAKYDLTTAYFVGDKCNLSEYGKSKDGKNYYKQVMLGIVINNVGLPFKWDVFPGNTGETTTLKGNIEALKNKHKIKNIILVFDKGIMSKKNRKLIEKEKYKYVSALNKNQIQNIKGIDLKRFEKIMIKNVDKKIKKIGLKEFDDDYYFDEIKTDGTRYIIGFSINVFKFERLQREKRIEKFQKWLEDKAKKLRNNQTNTKLEVYNQVITELKRLKIRSLYEKPVISKKYYTKNKVRKGYFVISILKNDEVIEDKKLKDGLTAYVTNIDVSAEPSENIIKIYREKCEIESVFKHLKSFLKIRPFNVNIENHVRATYTICVLSYFLNKFLSNRIKTISKIDYINSEKLYENFREGKLIGLKDINSGKETIKMLPITKKTSNLLLQLFPDLDLENLYKKLM